MEDFVIGRDVVFREYEALQDLLQSLPLKAQLGPKSLVGQVRELKEHGFQHLFSSLKEKAHDNLGNVDIVYTSFDVSHNVVALGSNLGMIFFFDRNIKKLTRFSSEAVHEPVTCIKLLPLQSLLASGHSNGAILVFSYFLSSKALPKGEYYPVSGIHTSTITCVEWSPDGALLYTGDEDGNIAVTIIKVTGRMTQTVLLFSENASIVQMSYSHSALLVSTTKRIVLWDFTTEQPTQVGQKGKKSPGSYGACIYPPTRVLLENEPPLTIYATRPGLRLWTADVNGKVLATLMYKGLMNGNPPGIRTLTPLPSPSLAAATRTEPGSATPPQFGRLEIFHGQFIVTWDCHRLWVLDTSPCALVCYHHSYHGNIVDVSTVGHEIYILHQKGPRLIKKISLIPKIPNPLLQVSKILQKSEQLEFSKVENGVVAGTIDPSRSNNEESSSRSNNEESSSSSNVSDVMATEDKMVEEPSNLAKLSSKLQSVVEEDYGDIVFRPKRASKKKHQENDSFMEPNDNFQQTESDSTADETSDISSELDFADRSVSNPNSGDDESPRGPRVTLINVRDRNPIRPSLVEQPSSVNSLEPSAKDLGHDIPSETECLSYSTSSTETMERTVSLDSCSQTSIPDRKLSQSEDVTSFSNDSLTGKSKEGSPVGLHDYQSFPQVYSSTPLSLSDFSFSEMSLDRSTRGRRKQCTSKPVDSSMTVIDSVSCSMGKSRADSRETPPVCLEADGSEELCDTVSWSSSSRTFSDFDGASLDYICSVEQTYTSQVSQDSKSSVTSVSENVHLLVDSWSEIKGPQGYVVSLDVSNFHIWAVTNNDSVFYCPTHFQAISWTKIEGQAKMIAVNNAGDVIWCIDAKYQAYARSGIRDSNLTGKSWVLVGKNVRHVAIDETNVLGIMMNGDVFIRSGASKANPGGASRTIITENTNFMQASLLDGLMWFVDSRSSIHVYSGLNRPDPKDKEHWKVISDFPTRWACLKIYGWSWIVDNKGSLWFTDKVSHDNPVGCEWYQVSLGQYLLQDKTLLDTLWSWVHSGDETKLITASPKAGIWILGKNGSLNSARGHLLGGHWQSITPNGIAKSVFWSCVSARGYYPQNGKGNIWALQPSGELICFKPGSRAASVESPSTVLKLVAASHRAVWGISNNFRVVQRLGVMEDLCPQGVDWKAIELSSFQVGRVCHISSGTLCTWAVDESGSVWLRVGDIEKTDKTISQVWIQVDGEPSMGCRFVKVAVSPDDAIVWALDDRFNVYARRNVAPNFQVGTSWEPVPGSPVKDICINGSHMVWAVCSNNDIACRYGVSEGNPLGNYWKKVPGNYEMISVTPDGELWAINLNGQLFRRKTKHFYGTQSPFKERRYSSLFNSEDEWEIL